MSLLPTRATLLSTRLSELCEWHLLVTCRCRGFPQHVELAPIAMEHGGRLTLERVLMKLRCRHCGAGAVVLGFNLIQDMIMDAGKTQLWSSAAQSTLIFSQTKVN